MMEQKSNKRKWTEGFIDLESRPLDGVTKCVAPRSKSHLENRRFNEEKKNRNQMSRIVFFSLLLHAFSFIARVLVGMISTIIPTPLSARDLCTETTVENIYPLQGFLTSLEEFERFICKSWFSSTGDIKYIQVGLIISIICCLQNILNNQPARTKNTY